MKKIEMRKKLKQAIKNVSYDVESLSNNSNPQVVLLREKSKGQLEAFQTVLEAVNGDSVLLNIFAANYKNK